jgi:hypothetical protein
MRAAMLVDHAMVRARVHSRGAHMVARRFDELDECGGLDSEAQLAQAVPSDLFREERGRALQVEEILLVKAPVEM